MKFDEMGRFVRFWYWRFILLAPLAPTAQIGDVLDTIIHEAIHRLGDDDYLARYKYSLLLDRRNPLCGAKECVARKATKIVVEALQIDKLPNSAITYELLNKLTEVSYGIIWEI